MSAIPESPMHPSLSFSRQPHLRDLFQDLSNSTTPVTLFCGAGVSVDSGLPTWLGLIRNLAEKIDPKEVRDLVLSDGVDLQRKAELILSLVKGTQQEASLVSEALYRGGLGGLAGGQLARAIAAVVAALDSRVRLVTTNYDDRLEVALRGIGREPRSLTLSELTDSSEWFDQNPVGTTVDVLHLHGYLLSDSQQGLPIVLSESDYFATSRDVQDFVSLMLEKTTVLFLGVSLTDSSIVTPLRHAARSEKMMGSYNITVRGQDPRFTHKVHHSYAVTQAEFCRRALGTKVAILKSYGQLSQCVAELALCIAHPSDYFSDDLNASIRYGFRLRRILQEAHRRLHVVDNRPASGTEAREASDLLELVLQREVEPLLSRLFSEYITDAEELGLTSDVLRSERFALFIWLRMRKDVGMSPYQVIMAGTSAYAHRHGEVLTKRAALHPASPYVAATAAFLGRARIESLELARENDTRGVPWRTFLGTPLKVSESDLDVAPATSYRVSIGALALHSNRRQLPRRKLEEANSTGHDLERELKPSILSFAKTAELKELVDAIAGTGRLILGNPAS